MAGPEKEAKDAAKKAEKGNTGGKKSNGSGEGKVKKAAKKFLDDVLPFLP